MREDADRSGRWRHDEPRHSHRQPRGLRHDTAANPGVFGPPRDQEGRARRGAADQAVARVAARHGATPSQVALAWLLQRDERILPIPRTSSVAHLEENVAAAELALDADDLEALEDVRPGGDPLQAVTHA